MKKIVSNKEYELALANKEYHKVMFKVTNKFRKQLKSNILKRCRLIALWKCLRDHKNIQKFTSSLYNLTLLECYTALKEKDSYDSVTKILSIDDLKKKRSNFELSPPISYNNDFYPTRHYELDASLDLPYYLGFLSEKWRQILIDKYIYGMTYREIGAKFNITWQRVSQIIDNSIAFLQKKFAAT